MDMTRNLLLVFLLAGCTTAIGCFEGKLALQAGDRDSRTVDDPDDETIDDEEPPPGTIMRPPDEEVDDEVCRFISPGETPLRRLTGEEYNNSVRDIFDFAEIPTQSFSPDERIGGFQANTVSAVTELQAEEYQNASEEVAQSVVANLDGVLDADPDEAQVRSFIETYGERAFRRPLETEEVDRLYQVFDTGRTEIDTQAGTEMVVMAMLQSPNFLYRAEVGEESNDEVVHLTDYEMASRMSYFFWGTTPDDTLLDAAGAGELSAKADIEAQARRMLDDPRARTRINEVFAQWLQVDQIENVDKNDELWTDEMRNSMAAETEAFIDHVIWEGEGTVEALLTADYTFVDQNTAQIYGLDAPDGEGMQRVDLPDGRRGILAHAGVLATYGHGQMPVHRGKFVRDAFLCLPTPEPPNMIEPLETEEGESMRSKAQKRMNADAEGCAGCHSMMDGIGLAFSHYDQLGRYQTEDEFGNQLSGDGEILYTNETDGEVDGVAGLAQQLASSAEVQSCVSQQFFRYAVARMNGDDDSCSLHMIDQALEESGNDIREMFVAIATTDAFRYRRNMSADM
jgi:hypothetical protein